MVEMEKSETLVELSKKGDLRSKQWTLFVDGASNENGSEARIMLISSKEHKIHYALHFGFQASNNEAEYEGLLAGLRLAKELKVCNLKVYSDSQLVVYQVNDTYQTK